MCLHNKKDAGVNKSSKKEWIISNFVYINPQHGTIKVTVYWFCRTKRYDWNKSKKTKLG